MQGGSEASGEARLWNLEITALPLHNKYNSVLVWSSDKWIHESIERPLHPQFGTLRYCEVYRCTFISEFLDYNIQILTEECMLVLPFPLGPWSPCGGASLIFVDISCWLANLCFWPKTFNCQPYIWNDKGCISSNGLLKFPHSVWRK